MNFVVSLSINFTIDFNSAELLKIYTCEEEAEGSEEDHLVTGIYT